MSRRALGRVNTGCSAHNEHGYDVTAMAESFYWRLWRYRRQPMTWRQWQRFPRVADYKNEYWDGVARYTARPKQMPCYLPLDRLADEPADDATSHGRLETRMIGDDDWPSVAEAFHLAMHNEMPLSMWHRRLHDRIATRVIHDVRNGGDGPLVPRACRLAILHMTREKDGETSQTAVPVGAALVVRDAKMWGLPDDVARTEPPMLDWIFVHWLFREHGIAGRLLHEVAAALREDGHRYLASNAMLANPGSVGLHWGRGFISCGGMMSSVRAEVRARPKGEAT